MAARREVRQKPLPRKESPAVEEAAPQPRATVNVEDIDDLLDEIDSVLEDQAVLISYRQRSGQ